MTTDLKRKPVVTPNKAPPENLLASPREFYYSQKTFKRVGLEWGRSNPGRVISVMAHTEEAVEKYRLDKIKTLRGSTLSNTVRLNQLGFGNTIRIDLAPDGTGLMNLIGLRRPLHQQVYLYSTIFDRKTRRALTSNELGKKPNCEMTNAHPDTFEVMIPYPMKKNATNIRALPLSVETALKKMKAILKDRNHIAFELNAQRQVVRTVITPLI